MADERYDPFVNAVVWAPDNGTTLNAAADPPAAPVAVEPEPEVPEVSDETPPPDEVDTPVAEEGDAEEPEEGETPERSRRPIGPRLSQLTQERNAEREQRIAESIARAKAEGRAEALHELLTTQALPGQVPREAPPPPNDGLQRDGQGVPVFPQEAQYATAQDYQQALQAYVVTMSEMAAQRAVVQERQRTAYEAAVSKIRPIAPNFEQIIQQARVPVNEHLGRAINDSPEWPALMLHLAQHPDEALQLLHVTARDAYKAVDRLEAQLAAAQAPPVTPDPPEPVPPPVPPPPPITPTRGRGTAAPRSLDQMSTLEFFAARNKEERAARH